ncbi:MAG: hypothetical protein QXJ06_00185 [Candidatus Aenigmatarchaeota archaeon]
MKFFLVVCVALLFLGIVLSQYAQNEVNNIEELNQNINENYFNISIRDYYFVNETLNLNFSSEYFAKFSILNSSMDYIAENISSNFVFNMLPGNYYLEIEIPELNYTNYTSFQILSPQIEVYPREIYVNESVFVFIKDYIGKNFTILIEPEGKILNFLKLNETDVLSFNFQNEGNYTISVNEKKYNITVLKKENNILNLSFVDENFFVNKNISFVINGSAYTSFNFSVSFRDLVIFQIKGMTNEDGFYNGFIYFEIPGNYTINFEYSDINENYFIEIKDFSDFNIDDFKINYEKNVSFLIKGPALTDFYLYFSSGNYTKVYYLRTNSEGKNYFEDIFEEGEYNLNLISKDRVFINLNFSVGLDKISSEMNDEIIGNNIFYKLDHDIISEDIGIFIRGNNITLDCGGYLIKSKIFAIFVRNSTNINLNNCIVQNSDIGLFIINSENIIISNFLVTNNSNGIIAKQSKNIKVINSDLAENEFYGLLFFSVENPVVENTNVMTNTNFEVLEKIKKLN